MTEGKKIRKLRRQSKRNMKRRLKVYKRQYAAGELEIDDIKQRLMSWMGHAKHGHTWKLRQRMLQDAVFMRISDMATEGEG